MTLSAQEIYGRLEAVRGLQLPTPAKESHSVVIPHATYSPWLDDERFQAVLESVRNHTLVDPYRLYELWSLVGQTAHLGGDILEVGVWRGGTGCLMAARAESGTVFLCDTFEGVVKASQEDSIYKGGEHDDASAQLVRQLAASMSLANIEILQGIFPDDTAAAVEGRRLALCHIDVDVYESARQVTEWAWPRLMVGGVLVYDDYGFHACDGVTRMVNELPARPDALTLHNLNGHAIIVKLA